MTGLVEFLKPGIQGGMEAVKLWALYKRAPVLVFGAAGLVVNELIVLIAVYVVGLVLLFREERKP